MATRLRRVPDVRRGLVRLAEVGLIAGLTLACEHRSPLGLLGCVLAAGGLVGWLAVGKARRRDRLRREWREHVRQCRATHMGVPFGNHQWQ